MRSYRTLLLTCAVAVLAGGCGRESADRSAQAGQSELLVFAAASLREAMEELGTAYQQETGTRVTFNFAGSNDLAHQIAASRGADLFLSASNAWMDTVQSAGRTEDGSRRDLLGNTLVIVGNTADSAAVAAPCALASRPFRNLAMGDPEAVPAGTYSRTWLRSVTCDGRPLWEAVQARVAPAPDVRAALGLVLADPRVIGIVYRTDQMAFANRTRVLYEVRDGPPIRYALARLREGGDPAESLRFYDFLTGERAAEVFRRHGFTPLPAPAPGP
jgi:molybdate transport system substrate-binding protein